MEEPLAILRADHEALRALLPVLRRLAEEAQAGPRFPAPEMRATLDAARRLMERCHRRRQEAVLLPALYRADPTRAGRLGARLLEGGRELRRLAGIIDGTLAPAAAAPGSRALLLRYLGAYGALLEARLQLEERELFPLVEAGLGPEGKAKVARDLERAAQEPAGGAGGPPP